jgi:hypothetical protein
MYLSQILRQSPLAPGRARHRTIYQTHRSVLRGADPLPPQARTLPTRGCGSRSVDPPAIRR